jgi:hypothetical protein
MEKGEVCVSTRVHCSFIKNSMVSMVTIFLSSVFATITYQLQRWLYHNSAGLETLNVNKKQLFTVGIKIWLIYCAFYGILQ